MKDFLVHITGHGEGCDYTMGCNHAVTYVNAENMEDAKKKWSEDWLGDGGGETPESATFYEIAEESIFDIYAFTKELEKERAEKKKEIEKKADLAELERLKAKLGVD